MPRTLSLLATEHQLGAGLTRKKGHEGRREVDWGQVGEGGFNGTLRKRVRTGNERQSKLEVGLDHTAPIGVGSISG